MRALFWLLALFALATLLAVLAGNNQAIVTVYWSQQRAIDLSLNLVVLGLVAAFLLLYAVLRSMAALRKLPAQARLWRNQQKERAMHGHLLDAMSHYLAGRFTRARKAAELALQQEHNLYTTPAGQVDAPHELPYRMQLRALAHYMLAESSQSLQDAPTRDAELDKALQMAAQARGDAAAETAEGIRLRAARWAIEDRDPALALQRLEALPHGTGRRILALRHKLKASRQAGHAGVALDTARALTRHKAFSADAGQVLIQRLIADMLASAYDQEQLQRVWNTLDVHERTQPAVLLQAAQRLVALNGDSQQVRDWLLPAWEQFASQPDRLTTAQRTQLVAVLEAGMENIDPAWLQRIEQAHLRFPNQPALQYLMGVACLKRQLWGKAQQLLTQSIKGLQAEPDLRRNAWRSLAMLAEHRDDEASAHAAWKNAAQV